MHDHDPIDSLGLSCPFGGTFYICRNSPTRFIGCCSSNPCGSRKGVCPDEHLRSSSFEAEQYNRILAQECINDNRDVKWYTCAGTTPPFLGCCAVNPCARGGCPDRQLRAAKLSDRDHHAESFLDGGSETAPGSWPGSGSGTGTLPVPGGPWTTYTTSMTVDTTTSETSTGEPESPDTGGHKGLNSGQIAGIVVGLVVFVFLVLVVWCWTIKLKKRQREHQTQGPPPATTSSPNLEIHHHSPSSSHSQPHHSGRQHQEYIRDTRWTQPYQSPRQGNNTTEMHFVHTSGQQPTHPRPSAPGPHQGQQYDLNYLVPAPLQLRPARPRSPAAAPSPSFELSGCPPRPTQQRASPNGQSPEPERNYRPGRRREGPTSTAGRTPPPPFGMAPNPAQGFEPSDRQTDSERTSGEYETNGGERMIRVRLDTSRRAVH